MARFVFVALLLLSASHITCAQEACSPASRQRSVTAAITQQRQLRAERIGEMDTSVPVAIQERVVRFKSALADAVLAVLACEATSASPGQIEATLAGHLRANRPDPATSQKVLYKKLDEETSTDIYATGLHVRVKKLSEAPRLLGVEVEFGISCGVDTILLLFEPTDKSWVERLRWQAPRYKEVSEAFGDFFLSTILQDEATHQWRLVVAHGRPWCTSRLSGFYIDVLEPGPTPASPRVVWRKKGSYSRGGTVARLRSTVNTFELRLNTIALNPLDYERSVIYRYRFEADRATRIEPIALSARGFVDEYLSMPWDEAKDQTTPAAIESMQTIYKRFQRLATDSSFVQNSDGPVRACKAARQFQVQIDSTEETLVPGLPGGRTTTLPTLYFRVVDTGNGYQMLSATTTPDPSCTGSNIMPAKH